MTKVSIPSPCNEGWNNMTPTIKGAFCSSCKIDVIDFTNKTNREIQEILLENRGKKLCGHIKTTQLAKLNQHYADWENQSVKVFQSKFLWACLIVFGVFLFTGCEDHIKAQPELLGEIEYVEIDSVKERCPSIEPKILNSTTKKSCPAPELIEEPDYSIIDGDMMIEDEYYDSLENWDY